jgi:hypothetical protein
MTAPVHDSKIAAQDRPRRAATTERRGRKARRACTYFTSDRSGGQMRRIDEKAPDRPDELHTGDVVHLREQHESIEAGTRGRVIGFYTTEPREALLALEDGREVRVPCPNLERLP